MRYNIRGQLLSINNSKLTSDGGVTNGDSNDVFGMQMLYDQTDGNLANGAGNAARFDGRLTAVKWMSVDASGTKSYERSYTYAYDGVNRYTGETYSERTTTGTGSFSNNLNGFDESGIMYDAGGNITFLNRNSSTQGTNSHTQIDALTYYYSSTNPNQLTSVSDAGTSAGFAGGSGTYTYDNNGNLTNEPYKGIATIGYNDLNRTDKITFSSSSNKYVDYTYDAGGSLIRKRQYDNVGGIATLQNTTDYIDGFVYVNSTLSYFPMPEGRVVNNSGTLVQEFILTDQQGNARVSFQNNGSGSAVVKQENSYYGFGMQLANSPVSPPSIPNKQLYNGGSEWQSDYTGNLPDYYQTFNRNYDAALGRFIGVDPAAESAESMTGYQYAGNNPILYNDPLGDLLRTPAGVNGPPTDSSSPGFHLDNGVVDQLNADMADFLGYAADEAGDGAPIGAAMGGGWQNSGAFDDNGPFSRDHGAAGRAFWTPSEAATGNYTYNWNDLLRGSHSYMGDDGWIHKYVKTKVTVGRVTKGTIAGQEDELKYLLPYSINWHKLGPGSADGNFYYANVKAHKFAFQQFLRTETGIRQLKNLVIDIPILSFGIADEDFSNYTDLQWKFATAWDHALQFTNELVQDGYINGSKQALGQFMHSLEGELINQFHDSSSLHVWFSAPVPNVPFSVPTYTEYPTH